MLCSILLHSTLRTTFSANIIPDLVIGNFNFKPYGTTLNAANLYFDQI